MADEKRLRVMEGSDDDSGPIKIKQIFWSRLDKPRLPSNCDGIRKEHCLLDFLCLHQ